MIILCGSANMGKQHATRMAEASRPWNTNVACLRAKVPSNNEAVFVPWSTSVRTDEQYCLAAASEIEMLQDVPHLISIFFPNEYDLTDVGWQHDAQELSVAIQALKDFVKNCLGRGLLPEEGIRLGDRH